MNKKLSVLFFVLAALVSNANAQSEWSPLDLQVGRVDPTVIKGNGGRAPIVIPTLYMEGYNILFQTPCDGCTLQLVSEDGEIEYSVVIPEGTETLTLPSDLSGEYELRIIRGQFCFWGYIEL